MLARLDQLWQQCEPAFEQRRVAARAQTLALSSLLCLGRHTVTGLLTTSGSQFRDWSADYRLFAHQRLPVDDIFSVVRRAVATELAPETPFCVALDDTLVRRAGRHTPGVGWRRDPLGPPFQANLVRAQRFLQLSAALPGESGSTRMAPIVFRHVPTPAKPPKAAPAEAQAAYRTSLEASRLAVRASTEIHQLRAQLDHDPGGNARSLWMTFDGSYTNKHVLRHLPLHTVAIGRIRHDARLNFPPPPPQGRGRRASYGPCAPTPGQFYADPDQPSQHMQVTHAGITHRVRFKTLGPLLWRTAGAARPLRLVVIAPLAYRPRKNSKLLYRSPAYLICTDPNLDARQIVTTYLKRWDIEVNFRDEKTLVGVGQAQVRNIHSVEAAPALAVASYAMLLVAAHGAFGTTRDGLLPQPKWAARNARRPSTQHLLHQLRAEVWAHGLRTANFSDFAASQAAHTKPEKFKFPLVLAACYANG